MGRLSNPRERLRPMSTKSVQAGNPARSSVFSQLAAEVQRFWLQCNGSKHTWGFASPDEAPRALITATGDEYYFTIGEDVYGDALQAYEVPWWMQENFDGVEVMVVLGVRGASAADVPELTFSTWGVTLVDTITTKKSASYGVGGLGVANAGQWSLADDPWLLVAANTRIYSANLPADRSFVIRPIVSYNPTNIATETGLQIDVRIHSWAARDLRANVSAAST